MVDHRHVWIFGRNEGAPWHPLSAVEAPLREIFGAQEVTVFDRGERLLAIATAGVDVLVALDDRWDAPADPHWLDAVEAWVRRGGHLLLIHNGLCWAHSRRWRRLAGGRFAGHGPAKTLTYRHRNGESFDLFEEPYRFSIPWWTGRRVEAWYQDEGRWWPALWSRGVGRGHISYAQPGHSSASFESPVYRTWLRKLSTWSPTPIRV